jgi:hypothetical protein
MWRTMVGGIGAEDKGPKGKEEKDLVLPWWYWRLLGFPV